MNKLFLCICFLLFLTISMPVFNAVNSIVMALSVLFIVLQYRELSISILPKNILILILGFITSLLISSVAANDFNSINYAMKFLYWMLPFFVVFYSMKLCNNERIPLYSLVTALSISAIAVIYQYYFLNKFRESRLLFYFLFLIFR